MSIKNLIKGVIVSEGTTMEKVLCKLSSEFNWSDSISNFSRKLTKETLRYSEANEIAHVLGYEIIWVKSKGESTDV